MPPGQPGEPSAVLPGLLQLPSPQQVADQDARSAAYPPFWRYTRPVLAASMVWGIAFTLYSVIMGHMGTDAVAANSIVSITKSLLSCLIRGVGSGAGILIGNLTPPADRPRPAG